MLDSQTPLNRRSGDNRLTFDGVSVEELATEFGTPLYVYSARYVEAAVHGLRGALDGRKHMICYSVKANSNLAILKMIAGLDCGADIVSGGELFRARKAGIDPKRIVFAGVGKTEREIGEALDAGILYFSVESSEELDAVHRIASNKKAAAHISLRVNPDVDPKTHPYISTGLRENKFGIPHGEVLPLLKKAAGMQFIVPSGIGFHIGSQLTDLSVFEEAAGIVRGIAKDAHAAGIELSHIGVGGGLGVSYDTEAPPDRGTYAASLARAFPDDSITLVFEPGRNIVANAGVLMTRILYLKENQGKKFFVCDAGMNDLIRPSLYGAHHDVLSDHDRPYGSEADLVGPVCESGDFLAKSRSLPDFLPGDLALLAGTGAYGFSMSSNYNSRPRAAEVLVEGGRARLIRQRETYDDLIRGEMV